MICLGQDRRQPVQLRNQFVHGHRVAAELDNGPHRIGQGIAKTQPQLIGEKAQLCPAFERAARGKGNQQAFCARGIASGSLRLQVKPRQPLFRRSQALIKAALLFLNPLDHFLSGFLRSFLSDFLRCFFVGSIFVRQGRASFVILHRVDTDIG